MEHRPDSANDSGLRDEHDRSFRFNAMKGIFYWGIPTALLMSIQQHGRKYGYELSGFLTMDYAETLAIALLVTGIVGGIIFAWFMDRKLGGLFRKRR
jgi:hypothetical protein